MNAVYESWGVLQVCGNWNGTQKGFLFRFQWLYINGVDKQKKQQGDKHD